MDVFFQQDIVSAFDVILYSRHYYRLIYYLQLKKKGIVKHLKTACKDHTVLPDQGRFLTKEKVKIQDDERAHVKDRHIYYQTA